MNGQDIKLSIEWNTFEIHINGQEITVQSNSNIEPTKASVTRTHLRAFTRVNPYQYLEVTSTDEHGTILSVPPAVLRVIIEFLDIIERYDMPGGKP